MKTWFTSDLHFFHRTAARHRGFGDDVKAMNRAIVEGYNALVAPGDTTYILGDVTFGDYEDTLMLLSEMRGQLYLIPGNHDKKFVKALLADNSADLVIALKDKIERVKATEHQADGTSIATRMVLSHYPILSWEGAHRGYLHLHGHSHGNLQFPNPNARIMDVGVDPNGLKPVSMDDVRAHMQGRNYVPFDHHKEPDDQPA